MGLEKYTTEAEFDKFELDEQKGGYGFPCNACKHRHEQATVEPCRSCGHNVNAVIKESEEGV